MRSGNKTRDGESTLATVSLHLMSRIEILKKIILKLWIQTQVLNKIRMEMVLAKILLTHQFLKRIITKMMILLVLASQLFLRKKILKQTTLILKPLKMIFCLIKIFYLKKPRIRRN